jgi:hypothetical protein
MTRITDFCRIALVFAFAGAGACGGSQDKGVKSQELTDQPAVQYEEGAKPAEPEKPPDPPGPPHLEFAEMTLFQGKTAVLKIHADGKTEMYDAKAKALAPGPTVKADGTFNFKEQDVARANPDGTIKQLPSGETLPVTVSEAKVVNTASGSEVGLALAADGTITPIGQPAPPPAQAMRLEGATTPAHRKTALAVVGALFLAAKAPAPAPAPKK